MFGLIAMGAASLVGGLMSSSAAKKAAREQRRQFNILQQKLNMTQEEMEQYSDAYVSNIRRLEEEFDPYDIDAAYASLYEGVIQPMEREFDESVLPQIQAAYSGGMMGAGAGMSGAAAEAESRARRGLMEEKAGLRYRERGQAIERNYRDYERRRGIEADILTARQAPLSSRMGVAQTVYGAAQQSIQTDLAARQAQAAIPGQVASGAMSGYQLQQGIATDRSTQQYNDAKTAALKART